MRASIARAIVTWLPVKAFSLVYLSTACIFALSCRATLPTRTLVKFTSKKRASAQKKRPALAKNQTTKNGTMKAPEAKSRLFGVLIGINQYSYKQGFQPLCCSTHDAYGLRELLVRETGANYQDVIVLPSHRYPATVQGIRKALLYHLDRATPRDKVIVTFVGYGATIRQKTSNHHVLVTPELNRRELWKILVGKLNRKKVLTVNELGLALKGVGTNNVIVALDIKEHRMSLRRSFIARDMAQTLRKYGHVAVVTSYAAQSNSRVPLSFPGVLGKRRGYGILTYALMEGLSGRAHKVTQTKTKESQWLDHKDLFAFLKPRVQQLARYYRSPIDAIHMEDPMRAGIRLRAMAPSLPFTGQLLLQTNPPQATVWLDGIPVGETPLRVQVRAGRHKVQFVKSGYKSYFRRFGILAGQQHSIFARLHKSETSRESHLPNHALEQQRNGAGPRLLPPNSPESQRILRQRDRVKLSPKRRFPPGMTRGVKGLHQGKMAYIPPGSFVMGSMVGETGRYKDEDPRRRVTLGHGFWMLQTEVTQVQFRKIQGYNPSQYKSCGGNCPVETLSWHEALSFANKLSKRQGLPQCYSCKGSGKKLRCDLRSSYQKNQGKSYYHCKGWRLPTEAEWEYAARAGSTQSRYGHLNEIAWYSHNTRQSSKPVKGKRANPWSLYDMLGNVYEWCWDWYRGSYRNAEHKNPVGPSRGLYKVIRGGSWVNEAENVRTADRFLVRPLEPRFYVGFRLVRTDR